MAAQGESAFAREHSNALEEVACGHSIAHSSR